MCEIPNKHVTAEANQMESRDRGECDHNYY
jgi:hypothetical protein